MDLGEEALLQLNDGDNEDDDYCWITKMQNKMKESIVDSSKMTTIQMKNIILQT